MLTRVLVQMYEKYKARSAVLNDEEGADEDFDDDLWMDVEDEEGHNPVEDIISSYSTYSTQSISMLFSPFVVLFVQWTERHIGIGASYGIKISEFKFFVLFNFLVIVPLLVRDIFMHNVTELFHGWKVYDYMKYCRHRYAVCHVCVSVCVEVIYTYMYTQTHTYTYIARLTFLQQPRNKPGFVFSYILVWLGAHLAQIGCFVPCKCVQ